MKVGVSACLLGFNYRYNGTNKRNEKLLSLIECCDIIPICPEVSSGFAIPHKPIEILNGRIIDEAGNDYTDVIEITNKRVFESIKKCDFLVLKSKSPTCGFGEIYDGSFSGKLIPGNGSFTKKCLENNIPVYSENDLAKIENLLKQ